MAFPMPLLAPVTTAFLFMCEALVFPVGDYCAVPSPCPLMAGTGWPVELF
jgi:hypothetical protein